MFSFQRGRASSIRQVHQAFYFFPVLLFCPHQYTYDIFITGEIAFCVLIDKTLWVSFARPWGGNRICIAGKIRFQDTKWDHKTTSWLQRSLSWSVYRMVWKISNYCYQVDHQCYLKISLEVIVLYWKNFYESSCEFKSDWVRSNAESSEMCICS